MSGSGGIQVISPWVLKATEIKEDVIKTRFDTGAGTAGAHLHLAEMPSR